MFIIFRAMRSVFNNPQSEVQADPGCVFFRTLFNIYDAAFFAKVVELLTIFAKNFLVNVW